MLVAATVSLEGRRGEVGPTTVGFNDQTSLAPEKVRLDRHSLDKQGRVDVRWRQRRSLAKGHESSLQFLPGHLLAGIVMSDSEPQPRYAPPTSAPAEQLGHLPKIEDTFDFRLGHRIPQFALGHPRGKVEQRLGDARAGNSLDAGAVRRPQRAVSVRVDSPWVTTPPPRCGHVDPVAAVTTDAPERSRRPVRKHGVGATGEDCCHPISVRRKERMADRVHALVNSVEPTALRLILDRSFRHPNLDELIEGAHPILTRGDGCNLPTSLPMGQKPTTIVGNRPVGEGLLALVGHARSIAGAGTPVARRSCRLIDAFLPSLR